MSNELELSNDKLSFLFRINSESNEQPQTFSKFFEKFEDNIKMTDYQNYNSIFFYFALNFSSHNYKYIEKLAEDLRTIISEKNRNNFKCSPSCYNKILTNYLSKIEYFISYCEYDIFEKENSNDIIALHKIIQIVPKFFENEEINNYTDVVNILRRLNDLLNNKLQKNFKEDVKLKIEKYHERLQKYINNFINLLKNSNNMINNNKKNEEKINLDENDLMQFKNTNSNNKNYTNDVESLCDNYPKKVNITNNNNFIDKNYTNSNNNQINNNQSILSNPYNMNDYNNNLKNSYKTNNLDNISIINNKEIIKSGSFRSNIFDSRIEESKDQMNYDFINNNNFNYYNSNNDNNNSINAKKNYKNSDNVMMNKENNKKKKITMVDERQKLYDKLEKNIQKINEDDLDF